MQDPKTTLDPDPRKIFGVGSVGESWRLYCTHGNKHNMQYLMKNRDLMERFDLDPSTNNWTRSRSDWRNLTAPYTTLAISIHRRWYDKLESARSNSTFGSGSRQYICINLYWIGWNLKAPQHTWQYIHTVAIHKDIQKSGSNGTFWFRSKHK